jgi:hypothetical protein
MLLELQDNLVQSPITYLIIVLNAHKEITLCGILPNMDENLIVFLKLFKKYWFMWNM